MIADAESSAVVTSAADCDREALLARVIHRCSHVGYIRTADDEVRTAIDHSIVHFASDFIFAADGVITLPRRAVVSSELIFMLSGLAGILFL